MDRKLRMGMVGGGRDAFIGAVHRMAAAMDNRIELVCGAFSSNRQKSIDSGHDLGLDDSRIYGAYRDMLRKEAKRPEGERMDFVAIVTPNNMHYPVAMAAIDSGFHVICDKPMTVSLDEATNLARKLQQTERLFCLTHNYTGYPMVQEARALVASGEIGEIRRVVVRYPQGWLSQRLEAKGQKQASWRTNPKNAGASCCVSDIGTHCHNLAEFVTGLHITHVTADLHTFVTGRQLDDDASILLRFENEARGVIWASQIAIGRENALEMEVYGTEGSLQWSQEEPNTLLVHWLDKPTQIRRTATDFVSPESAAAARLPAGHPEGFIEAFANIYKAFADAVEHELETGEMPEGDLGFPGVHDGVRGIKFVDAVVRSSSEDLLWVEVDHEDHPTTDPIV
jgi:predicted dehydrogenase